jgi:hypothetical protein
MKVIFSCVFCFFVFQNPSYGFHNVTKELKSYLPVSNEISGWKIIDSPQKYKGDNLFLFIDGGADIYLEYGFKQVINCMYICDANASIKIEIYEMKSPEAAYGIFSYNEEEEDEKFSVGNGGTITSYSVSFWKNNYLVSITGSNNDGSTKAGLVNFAKFIDSKIEPGGKKPAIVDLLYSTKENPVSVKYLKGNLALMNIYQFMAEDIFGVKEGAIGSYSDYTLFTFRYQTYEEANKWFKNASDKIKTNHKYSSFKPSVSSFSFIDKNKKLLTCYAYKNFLFVVLEKSDVDPAQVINRFKEKINNGI